jgi:predicted XRE-type DNA-binding protein
LSTSQPRVSDLLHGNISNFSLEMSLIYAQKLGLHMEIRTTELRKQTRSHGVTAVQFVL